MTTNRWILKALVLLALVPATATAQQAAATITGRVTTDAGAPVASASVMIQALALGTLTRADGTFSLTVPAARFQPGQDVQVSAQSVGLRAQTQTVTLQSGAVIPVNFALPVDALRLDEIVVTGAGTERARVAVGATTNTVRSDEIVRSRETNMVAALAGKAPNVEVTKSSGDPGAGAYFRIRGINTVYGGTQPLIVVDGIPIDNSTDRIERTTAGTVHANRAADLNPNDIASIEILKGPGAAALYGSRAASGVVLITTKSGQRGANSMQYRVTYQNERINQMHPLQTQYGQGRSALARGSLGNTSPAALESWGPRLACAPNCVEGRDYFDHAGELFGTGHMLEHNLSLSGGGDRTTYFLSVGRMDHEGVILNNSRYDRTSVRLKGSHSFLENLTLGGNIMYTDAGGDLIQQGSNVSGLLLGALRTPPEFDNRDYIHAGTGLHRSYRCNELNPVCPAGTSFFSPSGSRGYDNPFYVMNEHRNTTDVGRTIASVDLNYRPFSWLSANYTLGVDYGVDSRSTVLPKSSSDYPEGRMVRGDMMNRIWDSNLTLRVNRQLTSALAADVVLGQNLNQADYRQYIVDGYNLILGTDQLDFTIDRSPDEARSRVRTDGYFGQTTLSYQDRLFLTGAVRFEGSSTFGQRQAYPKLEASWLFTEALPRIAGFDMGRLRFSWGITGNQPPVYANVGGFNTTILTDSWLSPGGGLEPIYMGLEGVRMQGNQANPGIRPERTEGFDIGAEFAFLQNRVTFGATYYRENTSDVILAVPVARSTGFNSRWENVARIDNHGWELTLGLTPVQQRGLTWNVDAQWATNQSCVQDLGAIEFLALAGFTGSQTGLYRPDRDAQGNVTRCYQPNTFYGREFVKFGNGVRLNETDEFGRIIRTGVNIDSMYAGQWSPGDLYITGNGLPMMDPQHRPMGHMNPDWTASLRNTLQIGQNLSVSGLLDFSIGAQMWNGTRGGLTQWGTGAQTLPYHGVGQEHVFEGAGPGAGRNVRLNWISYTLGGAGQGFSGPVSQTLEDGSYVKLRDVTVSYMVPRQAQQWIERFGFSSMEVSLSGRNLHTWTNYSGVDPESNLTGQTVGRGLDSNHNPQTRSFVVSASMSR